ncbi:hypothetical protein Cob_v011566 [Colletotrichum orbiculare MAFF 240422]|uniref:Uncharacterized protein n=1 Tax=Colletotrichum orbiculare (strain 104-T / ATCC 96160 / CBS 514.97 / LARS 414 / MAFF 240422) TaxID=1213857 RepID=A0A484FBS8_COLOR|nr:hypothetical protein Cob_v011566 [Colletotrichum orbiculare MAFF 240422]
MGFLVPGGDFESRGRAKCDITLPLGLFGNPAEKRQACPDNAQKTAYVRFHISYRSLGSPLTFTQTGTTAEPHIEKIEPLLARFAAAVASTTRLEDAEMLAKVWWTPSESRDEEYAGDIPYDHARVRKWGVRYLGVRDGGEDNSKDDSKTMI